MRKVKTRLVIYGFQFPMDRPDACDTCRYWKNRRVGCTRTAGECPYLLRQIDQMKKCQGCPYAKGRPCTSAACYKDLVAELHRRRKNEGDDL